MPGTTALQSVGGQNAAASDMAMSIDAVCPSLVANEPLLSVEGDRLQDICTSMVQTAADGPLSYGLDDEELNDALQAIAGEELQSPQTQLVEVRDQQLTNIRGRLALLRGQASSLPFSIAGLTFDDRRAFQVASNGDDVPVPEDSEEGALLLGGRLGVFLTGGIGFGEKDPTSELDGFDFDVYGVTIGADYRITEGFIVGIGLGSSFFDADFNNTEESPSGQELDTDTYSVSVYSTYYPTERAFVDLIGTVGFGDYDSRRRVIIESETAVPSEDLSLDGDFDGFSFGVSGEAGYNIPLGGAFTLTPMGGLDYTHLDIDGFTETGVDPVTGGASPLAFTFGDSDADSFMATVGLQLERPFSIAGGVLVPTVRTTWVFELTDDDDGASVVYAADPTGLSAFSLSTEDKDENYGVVEAGLSLTLPNELSLFAEYGTVVALEDFEIHTVTAGLRKTF